MSRNTIILLAFVLAKILAQYLVIGPGYDLHRDEYLYLDQANHPAWGFVSVPPFMSWISALVKLMGNAEFWVHFFPAVFGSITIIITWKIVGLLNGGLFACCLAATAMLFSSMLRIDMLYQPNSFDILAWTSLYYCLIAYITLKDTRWLYLAGVVLAIGFLNKYNIIFLVIALLPSLIAGRQGKVLTERHFYVSLGLALLLVLPHLAWQIKYDLPVVAHMKELSARQLENVKASGFLKEQVMFNIGSFLLLVFSFVGMWRYKPFAPYRFVFYSLVITIILYLILKGKGYYALGLYPVQIAFGAVYFTWVTRTGKLKMVLRPLAILIPVILFIPLLFIAFPFESPSRLTTHKESYQKLGMLRWEDGKEHELPQDFADMLGWRELAAKTSGIYDSIGDENTLVIADNYGQAGAINFYNSRQRINAVSFNADYKHWFPARGPVAHMIVIKEGQSEADEMDGYRSAFSELVLKDSVENHLARERGTKIYLLSGAHKDIWPYLDKRLRKAGF